MSITAKIQVFLWAMVVSLVLMAVAAGWTMARSADDQTRIQVAYERYIGILTLSKRANRYSEQIAELVLLGEETLPDYQSARNDLRTSFLDLETRMTRNGTIAGDDPRGSCSICETDRLSELRALFHEIEATVDDILALKQQGSQSEAVALFRGTIEKGFDSEVELLLADARRDEQEALRETEREAVLTRQRVALFFAAVVIFLLLTALATGLQIKRALLSPVARLIQGVRIIGQGNLDHRITAIGADELSPVARHINEMADQLQNQRKQLLRARDSLEEQVRQRTAELTRANRRLRDVDRLRMLFLADISHELRTPLTVLCGEAEIALRGGIKSPQLYRESLELIRRKGEEMGRLVEDLLFLARAEADAIRFDKRPVRLNDVLESTVREGGVLIRKRDIEFDVARPDDEIVVDADPQRLKQAFMVMIVNAIQHSDEGARIEIAASASEQTATVRVADRGRGIPSEDLPYVFDRFYRGRNPGSSRQHTGSGLGLPIAKWIAEKHGGDIALTSGPDGTTVTLSLPRTSA